MKCSGININSTQVNSFVDRIEGAKKEIPILQEVKFNNGTKVGQAWDMHQENLFVTALFAYANRPQMMENVANQNSSQLCSTYKNKASLAVLILSKYFEAIRTERSCKKQIHKDKSNKIGLDLVDYTDENEELLEGISLQPANN
ncbi:hypothetical protein DDB_G0292178 [Dictyostelium discoideum AX4]|uniref:Uncharacterized protein n=1 Tax=Dictyostelium discoideum TaxID=44689 RepID=Q54DQ4_DICDI|nr:hypothetical protein DDB_G0292178 [Dictyostelium discoideum AX4]EAL61445.1 hypothetical protein DDB_G0292178 [Dictyostelium discoideum AX4]|eukprot:XP_629818.1 hypothetical protein DDB_G0292178 [Dictyostelium discoideum AX4]